MSQRRPGTTGTPIALNPGLDHAAIERVYARHGHVQVLDLLDGDAPRTLHAHLRARDDWRFVVNQEEKLFELDRARMTAEQAASLDQAIHQAARERFQFRYETIRLDERAPADDPLGRLVGFLNSERFLDFARRVTGADDIAYADAQATAYGPGDFLSTHTDDVEGKARRAAYVLGLTPRWHLDWGGLLLLHDRHGNARAITPALGALNLLRVPQPHCVSLVVPWAPVRRYSVTGWLRANA